MMAYNLCYCTLVCSSAICYNVSLMISAICVSLFLTFDNFMKVTPDDVRKLALPPESIHKTPSGDTFVKSNLQKVSEKEKYNVSRYSNLVFNNEFLKCREYFQKFLKNC